MMQRQRRMTNHAGFAHSGRRTPAFDMMFIPSCVSRIYARSSLLPHPPKDRASSEARPHNQQTEMMSKVRTSVYSEA